MLVLVRTSRSISPLLLIPALLVPVLLAGCSHTATPSQAEMRAIAAEQREGLLGQESELMDSRLFTLVPGRLAIRLPEGFAVPLLPGEKLYYQSMVLNLNEPQINRDVRLVTEVETVARAFGCLLRQGITLIKAGRILKEIHIVAGLTHQAVIADITDERVVAGRANQTVVPLPSLQPIGGTISGQRVVSRSTDDMFQVICRRVQQCQAAV